MNLAALQGAKLRKVEKVHDTSAPKTSQDSATAEEIEKIQNIELDINMDTYYDLIKDHTFETKFIPISMVEAKALIAACEHFQTKKSLEGLSVSTKETLEKMEKALQVVIEEMKGPSGTVFVKTTCRSAKDTAIFDNNFRKLFRESLSKKNPKSENDQVAALIEAATFSLQTRSAKEVIASFTQSERVKGDLEFALNKPERWDQYFVVRKWYEISPSMEFRGYVGNGELNALSQYNYACLYPLVANHKEEISKAIVDYFKSTMKPILAKKFTDYIIDFVVVGEKEQNGKFLFERIMVIELNPFLSSTDSLLFSWKTELNLLQNGPYEFRIQNKAIEGVASKVSAEWRRVLEEEVGKVQ